MFKKLIYTVAVGSILIVTGCSFSTESENTITPITGSIQNGIYHNDFFGMNMSLPQDWVFNETTDPNPKDASYIILNISQYEDKDPNAKTGAEMAIVADKLESVDNPQNGKDYLAFTINQFAEAQQEFTIQFAENYDVLNLGGQEFYLVQASVEAPGGNIYQKYYATVIDGYALGIIGTYFTDEQSAVIDSTINSITFN